MLVFRHISLQCQHPKKTPALEWAHRQLSPRLFSFLLITHQHTVISAGILSEYLLETRGGGREDGSEEGEKEAAWAPTHLPCLATSFSPLTSPQEDDIIGPVLCLHTVHHDLPQLLGQVGFDKNRVTLPRPHRPEHERVGSGKLQHLIRIVLGAAEGSPRLRSHLAGALWQ